jgi:hypothetical protein
VGVPQGGGVVGRQGGQDGGGGRVRHDGSVVACEGPLRRLSLSRVRESNP